MKTILVPTDFSETAINAINYAAALAQLSRSKLVLFHAFNVPIMVTEVPFVVTSEEMQVEEKSNDQMKVIVEGLQKKFENKLEVEFLSLAGFSSDVIVDVAQDKNCDLIVMGTRGADGSNKVLGSNTVDVIKHAQITVLVIPDRLKFQIIDKIVFAFDYNVVKSNSVFKPLMDLATLFNAEIMIFNFEDSRIQPTTEKALEGIKLEHVFETLKHTYWFSEHENVVEAIQEFAFNNYPVIVTMIRRSHNLFHKMLTKSNTSQMALYAQFPLLILHEHVDEQK